MKFTNVRELKAKTSEMLRTVEMGNTVLVTNHGRPTAMLVPVTEDDIEDAMLAYSPQLRKKIEAGLKDIRAGRTMPLAEYMNRRAKPESKESVTLQVFLSEKAQDDLDESPKKIAAQIVEVTAPDSLTIHSQMESESRNLQGYKENRLCADWNG